MHKFQSSHSPHSSPTIPCTSRTARPAKSRLFSRMGVWYFQTVEGKEVGPFRYRHEAESLLSRVLHDSHDQGLSPIINGAAFASDIVSTLRR